MSITDTELVERSRSQDTEAFNALVRRYAPRLHEVISRMIGHDPALAEDLLQDALLQAYRALPRFRGGSAVYTWLYRIATNCALGWLRKQKSHSCISLQGEDSDSLPLEIPDWSANPEKQSERRELADLMDEAVALLPESIRIVFILREIEGLSFEEIASILDRSQDVVRARLYRAKKALKTLLAPYLAQPGGGAAEKEGPGQ